jgi:hypothetical protein
MDTERPGESEETGEGGMTPEQANILRQIRTLMNEAYDHYFKFSDGYCKSAEGAIEVYYPNYFDVRAGDNPEEATGLMVYSYVLGPSRQHHWFKGKGKGDYATKWTADPFATALKDVQKWHQDEMKRDHSE